MIVGLFGVAASAPVPLRPSAALPPEGPFPASNRIETPEALNSFPDGRLKIRSEFDAAQFVLSVRPDSAFQQTKRTDNPTVGSKESSAQIHRVIKSGELRIVLVSDQLEKLSETVLRATGNVTITVRDMVITCNEVEYDEAILKLKILGQTRFRRDKISLESSGAEFDFDTQSIIFHDASGYFYDTSGVSDREFFLTGGMVEPFNAEKFQIYWGTAVKDTP